MAGSKKMFGFRSGKSWKSALVIAWIAFWALAAVILLFEEPTVPVSAYDTWLERFAGFFLMAGIALVPVLLSDFGWVKRVPLLGSEDVWKKVVGVALFALVWVLLFGLLNSAHSVEYQTRYAELLEQQRVEEEHARAIAEAERAAEREKAEREQAERQAAEQAEREQAEREEAQARAEEEARKAEEETRRAEQEAAEQAEREAAEAAEAAERAEREALGNLGVALMEQGGFTKDEALAVRSLLNDVGCGDMEPLEDSPVVTNGGVTVIRGKVNRHQVNVTAENHVVSYIQITDIPGEQWGWYYNWRGKLVYGIVSDRSEYDLYDSDTVDGGYVARYDAGSDTVVPWGQ